MVKWLTEEIPNQKWTNFQTWPNTSQCKNKWSIVSIFPQPELQQIIIITYVEWGLIHLKNKNQSYTVPIQCLGLKYHCVILYFVFFYFISYSASLKHSFPQVQPYYQSKPPYYGITSHSLPSKCSKYMQTTPH